MIRDNFRLIFVPREKATAEADRVKHIGDVPFLREEICVNEQIHV